MTKLKSKTDITLQNVSKSFGEYRVLKDISFCIQEGVIGCLVGPSGCGKTTLLRAIAGFEEIDGGEIFIRGSKASEQGAVLPPEKRNVGLVFQDYCLFPHLNVAGNIVLGLKNLNARERREKVAEWTNALGLKGLERAYPHELSGGQQQRVALARAMAAEPSVILLDEPFSNLDVDLRDAVGREIREVLKARGMSALWVTHDQKEAFSVADEIGVMGHGTLEQWGSSYDLYHEPANRFVADFIGQGVFIPGKVINEKQIETELGVLTSYKKLNVMTGHKADVLLRPDDIFHDDASPFKAEVSTRIFHGPYILYTLKLDSGREILVHVPSHHNHAIGEKIGIRLDIDHLICFSA